MWQRHRVSWFMCMCLCVKWQVSEAYQQSITSKHQLDEDSFKVCHIATPQWGGQMRWTKSWFKVIKQALTTWLWQIRFRRGLIFEFLVTPWMEPINCDINECIPDILSYFCILNPVGLNPAIKPFVLSYYTWYYCIFSVFDTNMQ